MSEFGPVSASGQNAHFLGSKTQLRHLGNTFRHLGSAKITKTTKNSKNNKNKKILMQKSKNNETQTPATEASPPANQAACARKSPAYCS